MYKALVLINDAEGGRNLNKNVLKVELQDQNLGRLVSRVKRHLEIVEEDHKSATQAGMKRVIDNPQA
jgi:hypothetical protein